MKKAILLGTVLSVALLTEAPAQTQTQQTATGVNSQQGKTQTAPTSSVDGMKRKGSGKMAAGATRNGNSNLSPTAPTNTQGSTSEGSASVSSTGGAKGTRTKERRPAEGPKDGTSTSGATGGSTRPTSTAGVQKEARTSDRNVSTGYPQPTGAGKPGTPAGSAAGKKTGGNSYPQTKN